MSESNPQNSAQIRLPPRTGQLAYGRADSWEVAVDETVKGPEKWFAQIEGPTVYFSFSLSSPRKTIEDTVRFIEACRPNGASRPEVSKVCDHCAPELEIGKFAGRAVQLLHDTEFNDRVFVLIHDTRGGALRLSILGEDLKQFAEALRQVRDELSAIA